MRRTLILTLCIPFIASFVHAEQATKKESLVVNQASAAILSGPGGGKMGELYVNSPVVVDEVRGNWAHVTLQTWIKKDLLGKATNSSTAQSSASMASTELLIEKFLIEKEREGAPKNRIYLTLTLKNKSTKKIKSWKALLVAQSGAEVLFREKLADDTKTIEVGGTTELSFFWNSREDPYYPLLDTSPEKLKLEFYQVELK